MRYVLFFLAFLSCIYASPTSKNSKNRLSLFDDDSIPLVDQPDVGIFNFTLGTRDVSVEKRAISLNYILFDIFFDGRNWGNAVPFFVQGEMLITGAISSPGTKNGANPVEVVLSVGRPMVSPVAGNIQYVTNRYLYPFIYGPKDASRVDFARVSSTATAVTVGIDTSLAAANQHSVFNVRTGITSQIYNPTSGSFNINLLSNGQITGGISLIGVPLTSLGWGQYKATISGKAKQRGTFSL